MTKARNLPAEVLLDALAHLPPTDIDGPLRFTSHTYRLLVERWGSTLPKHTVVLHKGSPPPQPTTNPTEAQRQPRSGIWRLLTRICRTFNSSNPILIGWCSYGMDYSRRMVALDADGLRALLGSERLGRVSHLSIAEGEKEEQKGEDKFLEQLGRCLVDGVGLAKFACMEVHYPLRGYSLSWFDCCSYFKDFPSFYQIHHFKIDEENDHMLLGFVQHVWKEKAHLIYHLTSNSKCTSNITAIAVLLSCICKSFLEARGDEFDFLHGGELLVYCDNAGCEEPFERSIKWALGQPADEPRRRVSKWLETPDDSDYSLAAFRDYYRRLEGWEWRVWRKRNPHLRGRGKYLRVMQKARGNGSTGWALHLKLFDGDGQEGNEADIYWASRS